MRLELIAYTPHVETLIATAMLTTTSSSKPSAIYHRLEKTPRRVEKLLNRLEVHHGSILEHNRFCWIMKATEREVLDLILQKRFFSVTRLDDSRWLLSCNLRTVIQYAQSISNPLTESLIDSILQVAPRIVELMQV